MRRAALHVAIMSSACALVAGWYYLRPLSPSGVAIAQSLRGAVDAAPNYVSGAAPAHTQAATWSELAGFARHVFKTYYGSFSWDMFYPPRPFYWLFLCLTIVAAAGLAVRVARFVRGRHWSSLVLEDRCASVLLLAVSLALSVLLVAARFLVTPHAALGLESSHARFILPALTGSCVLLALGFGGLPKWIGRGAAAALLANGIGVAAYAVWA
ncbi:MAG TPA: hypothetical protein VIR57_06280, partial [Chloroflexota bacterium]